MRERQTSTANTGHCIRFFFFTSVQMSCRFFFPFSFFSKTIFSFTLFYSQRNPNRTSKCYGYFLSFFKQSYWTMNVCTEPTVRFAKMYIQISLVNANIGHLVGMALCYHLPVCLLRIVKRKDDHTLFLSFIFFNYLLNEKRSRSTIDWRPSCLSSCSNWSQFISMVLVSSSLWKIWG